MPLFRCVCVSVCIRSPIKYSYFNWQKLLTHSPFCHTSLSHWRCQKEWENQKEWKREREWSGSVCGKKRQIEITIKKNSWQTCVALPGPICCGQLANWKLMKFLTFCSKFLYLHNHLSWLAEIATGGREKGRLWSTTVTVKWAIKVTPGLNCPKNPPNKPRSAAAIELFTWLLWWQMWP